LIFILITSRLLVEISADANGGQTMRRILMLSCIDSFLVWLAVDAMPDFKK
jgi:hypothetical protein